MIEEKFRYYAFISYQRNDEQWAKWLQHWLEHYKLPSNLDGRIDFPKNIRPVFKDTFELIPGNLPEQISDALNLSKYLIVICSPQSARSEWVNKEAETFMSMGRTENIIPFIIDGTPFSSNREQECFPQAILSLPREQELLGVNVNEMGRDAAAVKVVARMFDVRFDELWQRHEREQHRRRKLVIASVATFVLAVMGVAFWMYLQRKETLRANWGMMENHARMIGEMSKDEIKKGNTYDAILALLEIVPQDGNKPFVPEVEDALRAAYDSLQSKDWSYRYLGNAEDFYFSDNDEYIVCENNLIVTIYDSKTLRKVSEIVLPDSLYGSTRFTCLSTEDNIFYSFITDDSVDCYSLSSGQYQGKVPFDESFRDIWMRSRNNTFPKAFQDGQSYNGKFREEYLAWIKMLKKQHEIPEDAYIFDYFPSRNLFLYKRIEKTDDYEVFYSIVLYDSHDKKTIMVLNNDGHFYSDYEAIIPQASLSADGAFLAVSTKSGGTIVNLDAHQVVPFHCDNTECRGGWVRFSHKNQLLHSSWYDSKVKFFSSDSLLLVDSIKVNNCIDSEMSADGNICLVHDTNGAYVYFRREHANNRGFDLLDKNVESLNDSEWKTIGWEWEEGTFVNKDYEVWLNRGILHIKYKKDNRFTFFDDENYVSDLWGPFQNDKYLVAKTRDRKQNLSLKMIDLETGFVVKQIDDYFGFDLELFYSEKEEQIVVVVDKSIIEVIDFPAFNRLIALCREATNGMILSDEARRKFYLNK